MRICKAICLVVLPLFLAPAAPVSANPITFDLTYAFSGFSPSSPLSALFTEVTGGGDGVLVTMSGLSGTEFVTDWGFNVNPALTAVMPTFISGQSGTASVGTIKMDGDGYYDLVFTFPTTGDRFAAGDESVWFFPGLTAEDFLFQSEPGGLGGLALYTAAHVQGIDGAHSGWVTDLDPPPPIPEPATVLLTGAGLFALSFAVPRRKR